MTVEEESDSSGGGGTVTRVGTREKSYFAVATTSPDTAVVPTESVVTRESFLTSLQKFLGYLALNDEEIKNLSPEESTKLIVALRDIVAYLLTLIPSYE